MRKPEDFSPSLYIIAQEENQHFFEKTKNIALVLMLS